MRFMRILHGIAAVCYTLMLAWGAGRALLVIYQDDQVILNLLTVIGMLGGNICGVYLIITFFKPFVSQSERKTP